MITSLRSLVCSRTSLLRRSRVHDACKLIKVFGIRLVIETSLVKSRDSIVFFLFELTSLMSHTMVLTAALRGGTNSHVAGSYRTAMRVTSMLVPVNVINLQLFCCTVCAVSFHRCSSKFVCSSLSPPSYGKTCTLTIARCAFHVRLIYDTY